jgi:type II secretory pathway pseudopilin PulG
LGETVSLTDPSNGIYLQKVADDMKMIKRQQRHQHDAGFSLFEVLAGILMLSLFYLVLLQSTSMSATSKRQSLSLSEVGAWLQNDLEAIKLQARNYMTASLAANANMGDSTIFLNSVGDFNVGDQLQLAPSILQQNASAGATTLYLSSTVDFSSGQQLLLSGSSDKTVYTVGSVNSNSITITPALAAGLTAGQPLSRAVDTSPFTITNIDIATNTLSVSPSISGVHVANTQIIGISNRCNATTAAQGLADGLRDKLTGSNQNTVSSTTVLDQSQTISSTHQQFAVTRTLTPVNTAPYRRLQISYAVTPPTGTNITIPPYTTEVFPDAALACP